MTNHSDTVPHRLIKALKLDPIRDYEGRFRDDYGVCRVACPGDPSIELELRIRRRGYGAKPDEMEISVALAEKQPPDYPGNSLRFGDQQRPKSICVDGRRDPASLAKDVRRRLIDSPQTLAWAQAGINAYRAHRQALDVAHQAAEQMCEELGVDFAKTFSHAANAPRQAICLGFYLHGHGYVDGNLKGASDGSVRVNLNRINPISLEKAIRIIRILREE